MEATASGWDYAGYWNAVLGANRRAADVCHEFGLSGRSDADAWLASAEAVAWEVGGGGSVPPEWTEFRARALTELAAGLL
jgi:hypothetical protein